MAEPLTVHLAGSVAIAPGEPDQALLATPAEELLVIASVDGETPSVTIENRTGERLVAVAPAPEGQVVASLEPGPTRRILGAGPDGQLLAMQLASPSATGRRLTVTLVVTADRSDTGTVTFIGQLLVGQIGAGAVA